MFVQKLCQCTAQYTLFIVIRIQLPGPSHTHGRLLLAQDYHRFHFLTGATLRRITNVPGRLYTVNPIAINSPFADVLTQNKRAICMYDTPEYGPVAFVVIGATMVSLCLLSAATLPVMYRLCKLPFMSFCCRVATTEIVKKLSQETRLHALHPCLCRDDCSSWCKFCFAVHITCESPIVC